MLPYSLSWDTSVRLTSSEPVVLNPLYLPAALMCQNDPSWRVAKCVDVAGGGRVRVKGVKQQHVEAVNGHHCSSPTWSLTLTLKRAPNPNPNPVTTPCR